MSDRGHSCKQKCPQSDPDLLFQIKLLKDKVALFESGKKYVLMEELHNKAGDQDFTEMRRLRKEKEVCLLTRE